MLIDVARVLVTNERGSVLLIKRAETSKYFPMGWELPGGKVNKSGLLGGIKREVKEELGIRLEIKSEEILTVDEGCYCLHLFRGQRLNGEPIRLSSEHISYAYADMPELRKLQLTIESEFMLDWAGYLG